MGNELSGVLRQDDLEVSVKLMIKKRKDGQQIQLHKPQQQQSQLQQQQDNSSIPSDNSEEDEDEGDDEEDEEFEGDEVDPEDEEEEDEETEDAKTLVDELLQGEGEGKSGAAVTPAAAAAGLSKKRRGRPPKSASASGGEKGGASADEESPGARKRRKVGAGRPSSVKMRSNSANPILDICIAKTHLCPSYCLNVPPEFSNAYLEADKEYEVVDGGASCKTLGLCLKNKRCVVKRSHWKLFVEEHKLKCGDTVHLELLPSGDQIRIQVSKCDETLEDQEQKPLGQNGHAAAVAPVDLEKQLMAAAEVEAPVVEAPVAEVPVAVAEVPVAEVPAADVSAADPEIQ